MEAGLTAAPLAPLSLSSIFVNCSTSSFVNTYDGLRGVTEGNGVAAMTVTAPVAAEPLRYPALGHDKGKVKANCRQPFSTKEKNRKTGKNNGEEEVAGATGR